VAGPCLIGVKQPVPEFHEGIKILDLANGAPGVDAPQEQQFSGNQVPIPARFR
jgi:hypothetical protein